MRIAIAVVVIAFSIPFARADVYETTCHAVPNEATRINPTKAELIYKFAIDDHNKVAFIIAYDPQGSNLPSRIRRTHLTPLTVTGVYSYIEPNNQVSYKVFGLHNDRNGADYEVSIVDHDFKGKVVPNTADDNRTETASTRLPGEGRTSDECGIGE